MSLEKSYAVDLSDEDLSKIQPICRPPNDCKKLIASVLLISFSYYITAIATVIAHSRMPKENKQLPDVILDNVNLRSWALDISEGILMLLIVVVILIAVLHKHRCCIIRRILVILSIITLLRCLTMTLTSLPGTRPSYRMCKDKYQKLSDILYRAFIIVERGGMVRNGVYTCGDYIFSGHTVTLVSLTMLIVDYTPKYCRSMHFILWTSSFIAIILIIVGHEHYTVDVLLAFYITVQAYLHYHHLADNLNNRNSNLPMQRRILDVFYPIVKYFEGNVQGCIPNEFELPERLIFISNLKDFLCRISPIRK
ncbi:DgyrCDS5674 [Dimorphilus gyrociliatus]|uniref:DgyrCDS5674 n=1 Tax=Dimorphilus gyrociliatus TaxID=2664684 RepID=A0A7I8VKP3_9ANNE|nr:DgyrCDS5674 [Dimorphilus gyrociliatus]